MAKFLKKERKTKTGKKYIFILATDFSKRRAFFVNYGQRHNAKLFLKIFSKRSLHTLIANYFQKNFHKLPAYFYSKQS